MKISDYIRSAVYREIKRFHDADEVSGLCAKLKPVLSELKKEISTQPETDGLSFVERAIEVCTIWIPKNLSRNNTQTIVADSLQCQKNLKQIPYYHKQSQQIAKLAKQAAMLFGKISRAV